MKVKLQNFTVALIFFPYVQPYFHVSDVGFYWLILATIALMKSKVKISRFELIVLLGTISAFFFSWSLSFTNIKGLIATLAFLIAFKFGRENDVSHDVLSRMILITFIIYLSAGLIQLFYDPHLFVDFLSRDKGYAGHGGRGVESLTAEPTFLGWVILSLLILNHFLSANFKRLNLILGLFIIVFVSRSSSVIATIGILMTAYGLAVVLNILTMSLMKLKFSRRDLAHSLFIFTLILLSVILVFNLTTEIRFVKLAVAAISPQDLLKFGSVNDRFSAIYGSTVLAFQSYLMPHGFDMFHAELRALQKSVPWMTDKLGGANGRIMSFNGSFLYELGFLGLFLLVCIYRIIFLFLQDNFSRLVSAVILCAVILILFQAIPIGLPLFPFVLGIMSNKYFNIRCREKYV